MVDYSTDRSIRISVIVFLVFGAILTAGVVQEQFVPWLLSKLSSSLSQRASDLARSVTATALIGLFIGFFSRIVWPLASLWTNLLIPNFSGTWFGYIKERRFFDRVPTASGDELYQEKIERMIPVHMEITQTFFRIGMLFRSEDEVDPTAGRESDSTMAAVDFADGRTPHLRHTFARPDRVGEVRLSLRREGDVHLLSGPYSSSKQRIGYLELVRLKRRAVPFCGEVRILRGTNGPYLAISMTPADTGKYLRQLQRCVGKKRLRLMREKREERDGEDHHLTIIESFEMAGLLPGQRDWIEQNLFGRKVWVELQGLGRRCRDGNCVYFVIANSRVAQDARRNVGLGFKNLHVTLGFDATDLHNVAKDETSRVSVTLQQMRRYLSL